MRNPVSCLRALVAILLVTFVTAEVPRVLILSDTVFHPSANQVAKQLAPQAKVVVSPAPRTGIYHTGTAQVSLDAWLGEEPWDLVVFNIGLTDLVYRAPGMKAFRVMSRESGGVRTTGADDYRSRLQELVGRIRKTGAKVIWLNQLPISSSLLGIHDPGSEAEYNRIAAEVMTKAEVPVVDMHSYAQGLLTEREAKGGANPDQFAKKPLHPPIIAAICKELGLTVPKEK